jgi:hypothetical protein
MLMQEFDNSRKVPMLASELLAELRSLMDQYGDLRVLNADNGTVSDTSAVELLTGENIESVILISGKLPAPRATVFKMPKPYQ